MRSPTGTKPHDDPSAQAGLARRALSSLRNLPAMGGVLIAISLIGASWFVWDLVTDDASPLSGDRFERIDQYVSEQMDGSRIPGATLAIVEDGAVAHTNERTFPLQSQEFTARHGAGWFVGTFTFVPDLSIAVAAVAGLAALSGLARVVRLVRASSAANANMGHHPTFSATDPSVTTEVITPTPSGQPSQ